MKEFVAKHSLQGLVNIADSEGSIWTHFGVRYQPAWVFVDDDGSSSKHPGALGERGLNDRVELLLKD